MGSWFKLSYDHQVLKMMKRNILPISTPSLLKGLLLSLSFSWFAAESNSAHGQTSDQTGTHSLVEAGFEQIRLRSQGDTILVALESPQIRGSYRALGIALRNLAQSSRPLRYAYHLAATHRRRSTNHAQGQSSEKNRHHALSHCLYRQSHPQQIGTRRNLPRPLV